MTVAQEIVQLEARLDNAVTFTVVQYIHQLAKRRLSNAEIIAAGVVTCGTHVALTDSADKAGSTSDNPFTRTMLLLAGQALADMIQQSAASGVESSNILTIVHVSTVLTAVLVLASALSDSGSAFRVLMQRGLTVTMYIFADTIGNMIRKLRLSFPPWLLGLVTACIMTTWTSRQRRWRSFHHVLQGLNVVVVNVVIQDMTDRRDTYTQVFLLVMASLMAFALQAVAPVLEKVKDYAVWAAARVIGALIAGSSLSAMSGALSPVVLLLVIACKHLLQLRDNVLVHLVILVAINDVLRATTQFTSAAHGSDQALLLFFYLLVLDMLQRLA